MMKKLFLAAALCASASVALAAPANVLIKHDTNGMEITTTKNMCVMCHAADYKLAGKPVKAGNPTTMPADHWVKAKDGKMAVDPQRYNCTICHSPAKNN